MSASQKKDTNVSVGVRVRPRNEKEIVANMPVYFNPSPSDLSSVQELDENGVVVKHWSFDKVFGPESTNKEVFDTMGAKLVDGALEGYNTVMFMYGQTSSG
jgi:kinesin family protein 11